MTHLLACPSCSRPYDVTHVAPGTRLRCACDEVFTVRPRTLVAGSVQCGHCGAGIGPDEAVCGHCGVALRTVLCAHCGTRMADGARHCHSCGEPLRCQALRPVPEDVVCPRCGGELGVRVLEDGSLVECGACRGLWIESDSFQDLCRRAERSPSAPPPLAEETAGLDNPLRYIPCVRCGQLMVRRQFRWGGRPARVVLDVCRDHGVWLDGGELEVVLAFVRRSASGALTGGAWPPAQAFEAGRGGAPPEPAPQGVLEGIGSLLREMLLG